MVNVTVTKEIKNQIYTDGDWSYKIVDVVDSKNRFFEDTFIATVSITNPKYTNAMILDFEIPKNTTDKMVLSRGRIFNTNHIPTP